MYMSGENFHIFGVHVSVLKFMRDLFFAPHIHVHVSLSSEDHLHVDSDSLLNNTKVISLWQGQ